jgi:hypothetical protein
MIDEAGNGSLRCGINHQVVVDSELAYLMMRTGPATRRRCDPHHKAATDASPLVQLLSLVGDL